MFSLIEWQRAFTEVFDAAGWNSDRDFDDLRSDLFRVRVGQRYLYDQVVDGLWWRSLVGAVPLGLLLYQFPVRMDTMVADFTRITVLIIQVAGWVLVLWLLCRYQAQHAIFLGVVCFFLFALLITLGLDSLAKKDPLKDPIPTTPKAAT